MTSWRIATYNIRHGLGDDGRVDLTRTAQEIRALDADVIGLQEVDDRFGSRSEHQDQPALLAELLGMEVRYGATIDLAPLQAGGSRRRYGLALLTRHEILGHRLDLLPADPDQAPPSEPRGVLHGRIRHRDGGTLDVLVTHLSPVLRAHRAVQVQGILRLARDLAGPAVLMGDVNTDPAAPELAALAAGGWREAAAQTEAARRRPAALRPLRRLVAALRRTGIVLGATHPSRFPLRRIDALWVRGDAVVTALAVGARGSSDHRPVVATVLSPAPTAAALD
ncbi:endonuclease/exonuclease/phosphatase family protein [Brachybacterium sp. UNK5269]|uniref:endonuclease/exonuclease/phosphatase family protein n=1 Tax=Brachybacterium sp. UNK5269 TaxID=3408576 RepID=UPI003BB2074C